MPEIVTLSTFAKNMMLPGEAQLKNSVLLPWHKTLTNVVLRMATCAEDVTVKGDCWTLTMMLPTKSTA